MIGNSEVGLEWYKYYRNIVFITMRVLVACEESQRVCQAFRDKGHEAYSCDLLPTSGDHPEWHYQIDALWLVKDTECCPCIFPKDSMQRVDINCHWDLIIAFVPCDHLAVSGARWFKEKRADGRQQAAINFFMKFATAPFPRIAIENPIGIMSGNRGYLKKHYPDLYERANTLPAPQIIQPWQFGHMEQKSTCLWLKGLPPLKETNNVYNEMTKLPKRERERVHNMAPGPNRARDRAVTYQGVANAMATQWG